MPQFCFRVQLNMNFLQSFRNAEFKGGFHVTSSLPCWWTVNKRSLISSLCLSTSICSFHHCYLCVTTSLLLILENAKNLGCSDDCKRRKKRGWPYLDIFSIQAYAIKCVKKANFGCMWHSRNVLSTCKTNLFERLNCKTKVIDDIFKNYSGSCLSFSTYLGETSCILQSSSQKHLHFQIERKNLWQQKAKNALLQLTYKMELEHKRSRLSRFVRVIVINICYSCYFSIFFFTFC